MSCLRNQIWHLSGVLLKKRHNHLAVVDGDWINVFGGSRTDSECFNTSTNQRTIIDNEVFKNISSCNSVIDIDKRVLYTYDDGNVYSLSLFNKCKHLLYRNVVCCRLVLMHV